VTERSCQAMFPETSREFFGSMRELAIQKAGAEIRNWTVYGDAIHVYDHEAIFV